MKPSFEARWYRWLQSRMQGTSWTMSNNYFKAPTGKVVTQWPYGNVQRYPGDTMFAYRSKSIFFNFLSSHARGRAGRKPMAQTPVNRCGPRQ